MKLDRVRHGRQIRLAEIGEAGQERLVCTDVVLGATGTAREIEAAYAARSGMRVVDDARADAKERAREEADGRAAARTRVLASLGIDDARALEVADGALRALLAMRRALGVDAPPWVRGGLTITRDVLERVDAEARAAEGRDEESCGLLTGPAAEPLLVDAIHPMVNRANELHQLDPERYPRTGRMYFDIDPLEFERAVREGEATSRPVKVLYHSHLDVGAYFSATDAAAATMGGERPSYDVAYLVTSVRGGVVDDHKLFVWDAERKSFVEAALDLR